MSTRRSLLQLTGTVIAVAVIAVLMAACGSSSDDSSPAASASAGGFDISQVEADPALNAMLPDDIKSAGVIKVATNIPYPPWEMYTEVGSQQPTGIDYDLSQALAAKLGVKSTFDQTVFDAIIPALQAGKEDIVMASMFDNAERQQELDFVDYATDGYAILVLKGNPEGIQTIDDLAGKKVAVQSGTSAGRGRSRSSRRGSRMRARGRSRSCASPRTAMRSWRSRAVRHEAQMDDQSVAEYTVKTFDDGNAFESLDDPSVTEAFESAIIGIGVPKDNPQLRDATPEGAAGPDRRRDLPEDPGEVWRGEAGRRVGPDQPGQVGMP